MDIADRVTAAYHRLWERAAESTGHPVERDGGVSLVSSGSPVQFFNRAFVEDDPEDPAASLDRAREFFGDLPFLFEVRRGLHPRAAAEATRRGLPVLLAEPGMAMSPIVVNATQTASDDLEITLASPEDLSTNLEIQAEAFEVPVELITPVFLPLMTADNVRCFTGWHEGEPVATSVVVADDGLAGVYSVATRARARGRGFGQAMTAAALRAGVEELGCTASYLQASAMGKGIYERMGYRVVAEYDGYACTPA